MNPDSTLNRPLSCPNDGVHLWVDSTDDAVTLLGPAQLLGPRIPGG